MKQRNHFLDIAKGIATILVIITHFSWEESERLQYLFPFWVSMAVPIFMIISGYLETASFEKKGIGSMMQAYDGEHLLHKFLRYSTPFIVAYALDILLHSLFIGKMSFSDIIAYFFRGGTGGAGTYYYPILLQFIFLFPMIYFIVKRYRHGLLLCLLLNVAYEVLVRAYMLNGKCYRLLIFRYIMLIAFGCYLYENEGKKLTNKIWILFFVGLGFIIATDYMGYQPVTVKYWKRTCVYAILYFLPLFGYAIKHWKAMHCRILELLGRFSYHIFFTQMIYYNYFSENVGNQMPNRFSHLIANIVICVSVGAAFFYMETPFSKFIMKHAENFYCRMGAKLSKI